MRRRRDERGAIALLTAGVMVVVLAVAAFVVDIGMQRVARQDLQALADVVALDLARMLDGRTARDIESGVGGPKLSDAVRDSQARNDADVVGDAAELDVDPTLLVPIDESDPSAGWRTAGDAEVPQAVRVVASTRVDFAFAGVVTDSGGASRSATAASQSSACFHLGSYAIAIERDDTLVGPLNEILGLGLSVAEYRALAAADLSLDDLVERPGIGTVARLLDGPLTVDELVEATVGVLRAEPEPNGPAIAALDDIDVPLPVVVRDAVQVSDTDLAALRTDMFVLDLLAPAILAATGIQSLDTAVLTTALTEAEATLVLAPGGQRVCGPGDARAASIQVDVAGGVDVYGTDPTLPVVQRVDASATVSLGLGGARSVLSAGAAPECRATEEGSDRYSVDVVDPGLSVLDAEAVVRISGDVDPAELPPRVTRIRFTNATFTLTSSTGLPADAATSAALTVPDNAVNGPTRIPVPTGTARAGPGAIRPIGRAELLAEVVIRPLGDPRAQRQGRRFLADLRRGLDDVVDTVVEQRVRDALDRRVGPLADLLGARRAGGDVYSEVRPTCNGVRLVG